MTESVADRMQLCKDRYNDIPQCLIDEVRALENNMTNFPKGFEEFIFDDTGTRAERFKIVNELHYRIKLNAYKAGIAQGRRERDELKRLIGQYENLMGKLK